MSFSSWVPHIPDITHGKGIGIGTAVALGCLSVLVLLILFFVIRAVCRRRRMYAYMKKQEQYSSLLNAPLLVSCPIFVLSINSIFTSSKPSVQWNNFMIFFKSVNFPKSPHV